MHNLEPINNHVELAKSYLLEQYKNRPKLDSLMRALVSPIQDLENKLYEIYLNHSLEKAGNYYLDRIGTLVGEARAYRPDDEYKAAILARIMINNGGGTPEDIISALRFTFNPRKLSFAELYPACFSVFIQGSEVNTSCRNLITSIKPAGISDFVIVFTSEDNPFVFAECTSENVIFRLKKTIAEDDCPAEVKTKGGVQDFEVASDILCFPEGQLGFGEIIITKTNLNLSDEDIYLVDEDHPLAMVLAYEDFIINGGSKLAEVIENGGTKETQ